MLFKNVATFAISGSAAALSITVLPFALTAASIILIVAPTLGKSRYILLPFNLSASIIKWLSSSVTLAPNNSNPFKWRLIGLAPIEHPPGKYISTLLNLPNNAPIK